MEKAEFNSKELMEGLVRDARSILMSPKVVTERLTAIGAASFAKRLCLRIKYEEEYYLWGDTSGIADLKSIRTGDVAPGVTYEFLGEEVALKSDDLELSARFEHLAKALWGSDIRKHGAITFDRDVVKKQIAGSLAAFLTEGSTNLGVVFIDIDHFKNLNTHITQSGADKVIQMLNRQFHDMTRECGGLAFNRSGDEFFLFLPFNGLLTVLQALHTLRTTFKNKIYKGKGGENVTVDLSMGVALMDKCSSYEAAIQATDLAEAETKDHSGNKRRGQITIRRKTSVNSAECTPQQLLRLGSALIRRRLHTLPFNDPYLNFVSLQVSTLSIAENSPFDDQVNNALAWLGLSITSLCWESSLLADLSGTSVPRISVALAVAHGVASGCLRNESNVINSPIVIIYSKDGTRSAVTVGGVSVWGTSNENDFAFEVLAATDANVRDYCLVGVQVGLPEDPLSDSGQLLPVDLFDQIVLVDERPISGGNLPDFWQPAIAEVFAVLGAHDADPYVVVWGPAAAESETYRQLSKTDDWHADEVAKVAKLASADVEVLKLQIQKSIKLVGASDSLADVIFNAISPVPRRAWKKNHGPIALTQQDPLTRPMLSRPSLPLEDGLRCTNAAQAYPILIDLLRKGENVRNSTDDAKGNLKELLAFKLILEDPLRNDVPAYLERMRADLGVYARRTMLDKENGLFRKLLESTQQVEAFVEHLTMYLRASAPVRSTRRACLVVPNVVENGEPKPLGLLSVWASPRVGSDRHLVDFVFVWRTVEAFVGLPYSLYGSIRLAENLIMEVAAKLPTVPNGRPPSVGELTYIPMSLHMRVDEFHARIAKRIIDESSD